MKKTYITPKLEAAKINSEDPTTAFVTGNYNSLTIVKADNSKTAANIISY